MASFFLYRVYIYTYTKESIRWRRRRADYNWKGERCAKRTQKKSRGERERFSVVSGFKAVRCENRFLQKPANQQKWWVAILFTRSETSGFRLYAASRHLDAKTAFRRPETASRPAEMVVSRYLFSLHVSSLLILISFAFFSPFPFFFATSFFFV